MERDLNDAVFFIEVVDHESFSGAARRVGVPVSTISRRIARLESRLGVALLTRTTRKLALTDAGRVYHDRAVRAVAEIDEAERLAQDLRRAPKGKIRIASPRGIAMLLWPAIAEFLEKYPDVAVDLDAHERRVHLVDERYDLTVVTGPLDDSSMMARKLLEGAYGLFASPMYIARRGAPRSIQQLEQHDCIVVGERRSGATWSLRQGRRSMQVAVRGRIRVNEMGLAHQATLDGYGIGRLPPTMVVADIRAGRLTRVLPNVNGGPVPAWIVYPAGRALSASMRAFVDHLVERVPRLFRDLKGG